LTEEISCVGDCDKIVDRMFAEFKKDPDDKASFFYPCMQNQATHGIWFRGESHAPDTQLEPSVLRPTSSGGRFYQEGSAFNYARNRVPQFAGGPAFDLFTTLSKMQHYGIPTRLLDWSESILVALFFAVKNDDSKKDAWLFCLNARKLNRRTGMRIQWDNIHDDTSYGTKFRVEFVLCATQQDWFYKVAGYKDFRWLEPEKYKTKLNIYKGTKIPIAALKDHCTPIAVLPGFATLRQQIQRTVFTLHGGKRYGKNHLAGTKKSARIPEPESMFELNKGLSKEKRFLLKFRIKGASKERIRNQLMVYGIHEGTLFPDSDNLGGHIKEMFK